MEWKVQKMSCIFTIIWIDLNQIHNSENISLLSHGRHGAMIRQQNVIHQENVCSAVLHHDTTCNQS